MKKEDVIHDCYYDIIGKKPTKRLIKEIYDNLPYATKEGGDQWGWNDTVVGDEVYRWIEKHKETLK